MPDLTPTASCSKASAGTVRLGTSPRARTPMTMLAGGADRVGDQRQKHPGGRRYGSGTGPGAADRRLVDPWRRARRVGSKWRGQDPSGSDDHRVDACGLSPQSIDSIDGFALATPYFCPSRSYTVGDGLGAWDFLGTAMPADPNPTTARQKLQNCTAYPNALNLTTMLAGLRKAQFASLKSSGGGRLGGRGPRSRRRNGDGSSAEWPAAHCAARGCVGSG